MDILQRIKSAYSTLSGNRVYTQTDTQRVVSLMRSDKGRRLTAELMRQTDTLTKKDVGMWRAAWQLAINVENPQRTRLYDIYTDNLIDLHLQGAINQRKGMTKRCEFRLVKADGKEDKKATDILRQEWFSDYCDYVLDARFWGHSLIQFGDTIKTAEGLKFSGVELVPRKHVCPEHGVLLRTVGDDWRNGIDYREGEFSRWAIEAGKKDDLGLLLSCSPQCISKRNMLGFWDMFGEIFGAPMRIAKATTTDDGERRKIEDALENMGNAFWGLFPDGTEIEIKESSRGDAYNVFDKRIDRCNSEMSKGILNQTMTIDSGSSLSQSETHLEVFENVVEDDKTMLAYNINGKLLPFIQTHGFKVDGLRFEWNDAATFSPSEQREMERVLLEYYEIDPQYFVDKYNVNITGVRKAKTQPDALDAFFQ